MMRASRREADLQHVMAAAARMKYGAAPSVAMRIDKRVDGCFNASLTQGSNEQVPFPAGVGILVQMLQGAAAANSEMPANRVNPLRARFLHIQKAPPIRLIGHGIHFDDLAWQRSWDINRSAKAVGYSVAALAKSIDQNSLNHGGSR